MYFLNSKEFGVGVAGYKAHAAKLKQLWTAKAVANEKIIKQKVKQNGQTKKGQ